MSEQLRTELIRILKTGDIKNNGAFTVAIATQVEKVVVAAREILMTESLAQNDLASLMLTRKRQQHFGLGMLGGAGGDSYVGAPGYDAPLFPMPVNNENFGVQAIKQLVDGIGSIGETPAKLVEALAVARHNELHDVAASIEKKLGLVGKNQEHDGSESPKAWEGGIA